jgi:hypothetical protein
VDPQFSKLKKELDKIKPLKLQPPKNGPNAGSVKSDFKFLVLLLLLLSILTLFLYSLFAKSARAFLRRVGVTFFVEGILLVSIDLIAGAVVSHQASTATESLVREAVPLAAHPLLSPFLAIGLLEIVIGVLLFVPSYLKRMNVQSEG